MDHDDSTVCSSGWGLEGDAARGTPVLGLTRRGDLQDEAPGVRSRGRRHPDDALLARGAARAGHRDHPAGARDRRPIIPDHSARRDRVDILNREVRAGTSVVHLSGIEQSLLYLLASRSGRIVTREEILDTIWGTDFIVESNIVDRHIRSLRVKLQNNYRHPRFIETIRNRGYRFIPTFSNVGWAGAPAAKEHTLD